MGSLNFLHIHGSTHEKSWQFLPLEMEREQFEVYSSFNKGTRWLAEELYDWISSKRSRRQRSSRWRKPSRWSCGMEPLRVLRGEKKRGQAGEKTLAPLPVTETLNTLFLTTVKPSPVKTSALPQPLYSFLTSGTVCRTAIAITHLGMIIH